MTKKTSKLTIKKQTENETIKERIKKKKKLLIEQLKTVPIIQAACAKAGVDRSTYYRWQKESIVFKRDSQAALKKGIAYINDVAESKMLQKIHKGNNTMIIFWLKKHHEAYADRLTHYHAATIIAPTETKGELTDAQRERIANAVGAWREGLRSNFTSAYEYTHPDDGKSEKQNKPERMIRPGKK